MTREARQQSNRYFRFHFDDDGSLVFKGSLPAVSGSLFLKALQTAMEETSSTTAAAAEVSAETPSVKSPIAVRRADALGLLAESFIENGSAALNGGDRLIPAVSKSCSKKSRPSIV